MRILAVSYLFPNSINPSHGIFVLNRLRALQKYCEIKVINPIPWFPFYTLLDRYKNFNRIPKQEIISGVVIYHPRYFSIPRFFKTLDTFFYCLAVLPLALKLRKRFGYDLVDLHWTYPDLPVGTILTKILNLKMLVTIRGKEAFHDQDFGFRKYIVNFFLKKADCVINLSEELKKICIKKGVEEKKTDIVGNGVDTKAFYFLSKDKCRQHLGLARDQKIILAVGSLIYGKGFDRVIRIFPQIVNKFPDCHFYIVGSEGPAGNYRKKLRQLVKLSGIEKQIHFQGQIENQDLFFWYNAADIFCLSSRGEGSPNVLVEALACGCPSVAVNVGSTSDILSENFLGNIVPNENHLLLSALLDALASKYDRKKIADYLSQFDWDWCAKNVLKVYQKTVPKSSMKGCKKR